MNNNNNNTQNNTNITIVAPRAQETMTGNNLDGWGPTPTHIPSRNEGGWASEPSVASYEDDAMDIDEQTTTYTSPSPPPQDQRNQQDVALDTLDAIIDVDIEAFMTIATAYASTSTLLSLRRHIQQQLTQLAGNTARFIQQVPVRPHPQRNENQQRQLALAIVIRDTFPWVPLNLYCEECRNVFLGHN
ncbi:hypothetical protein BDB00DRAFT_865229 [Zychaea mexicana]|uniref:uncharacterized protein n=1 Tax=Zychaea mexicana TaxID=64656 RepID=UPI0022FF06D0|nr:uncharacterized protein BDB00DRAFT_865229 [Zychaea mexicana]KAI9467466.1 hypothetical protein BDB00DRAFT_865229 [Zychaea mexicana]